MADLLQEIHTLVSKLNGDVGELRGQVRMLVDQGRIQDDRVAAVETRAIERHDALETRVRAVENRQHWYAGVSGAAGIVIGWIGQGLWKH